MAETMKKILHVEDDPDFQRYVVSILSDSANITQVMSLKEARTSIAQNNYDLVIIDFTLPDGSGSELVAELATDNPSIPVIVFSAHEITETMNNVKKAFVKGRFVEAALIDTVRRLCA